MKKTSKRTKKLSLDQQTGAVLDAITRGRIAGGMSSDPGTYRLTDGASQGLGYYTTCYGH